MSKGAPGNLEWFNRAWLDTLRDLAAKGDGEAGRTLHAELAAHLEDAAASGRIDGGVAGLLRDMHAALARGDDAKKAMFLQKPSHAPTMHSKEMKIYKFIEDVEFENSVAGRSNPPRVRIYEMTAKRFKLSPSRVKAIYLRLRQAHDEARAVQD